VYNGEIYNYPELKSELSKRVCLRTRSDTEVSSLSISIWARGVPESQRHVCLCVLGLSYAPVGPGTGSFWQKALFYSQNAHTFLFGSELKALLAYGGIERQVNLSALHEYCTYSYIVGEQQHHQKASLDCPPGHVLVVHDRQVTCRSYWDFTFHPAMAPPDEEAVVEQWGNSSSRLSNSSVKRCLCRSLFEWRD